MSVKRFDLIWFDLIEICLEIQVIGFTRISINSTKSLLALRSKSPSSHVDSSSLGHSLRVREITLRSPKHFLVGFSWGRLVASLTSPLTLFSNFDITRVSEYGQLTSQTWRVPQMLLKRKNCCIYLKLKRAPPFTLPMMTTCSLSWADVCLSARII